MTENEPLSDDNDDEYELEPVDPEILKHERQRAEEKTRQAKVAVDIDQAYSESEPTDPISLDDLKQFRFTTRHLLIATALLSVFLTLGKRLGGCFGWFIAGASTLAAGWYFVLKKERRERLERDRRREEANQRVAAERGQKVAASHLPAEGDAPESKVAAGPAFRFSFSLKEMFITLTVAAVFFALVSKLGGADNASLLLGMIALIGLAVQLLGFELPPIIVLGWWLLLVLYIVVSLWAAFGPGDVASVKNGSNFILGIVSCF